MPERRSLLISPDAPADDGTILSITPDSAGWQYVGFEVVVLGNGARCRRETGARELCVVVVQGRARLAADSLQLPALGSRARPWAGLPDAVYLPPGETVDIQAAVGGAEIALCWAPAPAGRVPARALPGSDVIVETRGHGAHERFVRPILMGDQEAESLLVCEVITPAGHWSSYPPHKHDRDNHPTETRLEETYYHRVAPAHGFALQRVYSDDRTLDESMSCGDRSCVLVPRGYHTVSAAPGYDLYYLNVMAGPVRAWAVTNDPDHQWTLHAPGRTEEL